MKNKIRKGKIVDQHTKMMEKGRKENTRKASLNLLKKIKSLKVATYCRVSTDEQYFLNIFHKPLV